MKYQATNPEFSGPHPFQTQTWAKLVRRMFRRKEYLRWSDKYCHPLTVFGSDNLSRIQGPVIFVPNHQSHMDTPVIMSALPTEIQDNLFFGAAADRWFVKGKEKLILQPWYQSLALGNFPIIRGGGSKSLDYAKTLLDKEKHICIFPEGTRSTTSELGKFRHGVAILAREKQVPLVPVILKGLREMRPKGSREITAGPVSVTFLAPMHVSREMAVEDATALLQSTMNREFGKPLVFPTGLPASDGLEKAA
jgi:1-acyl-sn-glycerol-3-phosphate acyltransferase